MPFFRFMARWTLAYIVLMAVSFGIALGRHMWDALGRTEGRALLLMPLVPMILALAVLGLVRAAGVTRRGAMVVQFLPYPLVAIAMSLWLFVWWAALGVWWSAVVHGLFAVAMHAVEFRPAVLAAVWARRSGAEADMSTVD